MVFGLWSSGHCLAPGLPGHCLLQQCMQRCLPGLDMVAGQSCECSFIVQSVVFGHSTKTWFKFQNDWSKSVPETVPERKPEPETTHSGTHSGDKCVVFAIPPVAANFFYRRVWTFIVHELSSKWVKKGFCAG